MTEAKVIEMIIKAYVSVMGIEKWNSLTETEQHDVIMTMVKDCLENIPF